VKGEGLAALGRGRGERFEPSRTAHMPDEGAGAKRLRRGLTRLADGRVGDAKENNPSVAEIQLSRTHDDVESGGARGSRNRTAGAARTHHCKPLESGRRERSCFCVVAFQFSHGRIQTAGDVSVWSWCVHALGGRGTPQV